MNHENNKYRKVDIANKITIVKFFCQKSDINWTNNVTFFVKRLATLVTAAGVLPHAAHVTVEVARRHLGK